MIAKGEVIDKCPLIYENKIYFGGGDGNLYCLNKDGKEIFRFKNNGSVWSAPVAGENKIYFGSWDCHLYCIDAQTGSEIWRFTTSNTMPSYIPPAYECFETELKIRKSDQEPVSEGGYRASTFGPDLFGIYNSGSPYKTKSAYKTKSEYK
jgi:hypothetical protein